MAALVVAAVVVFVLRDDRDDARTSGSLPPPAEGVIEVGATAPDFTLPGLDGGAVSLNEPRGRPVVLNFWASWCTPCREEFPMFERALARHGDLRVIGVSYEDLPADARRFADEQDADWPLAVDPDDAVARAYGVPSVPTTFLIDRDGRVAQRLFGISSEDDFERELRRIL